MKKGEEPCVCETCIENYVKTFTCEICEKEKTGKNFSKLMRLGEQACHCHSCRALKTSRTANLTNFKGEELMDCLGYCENKIPKSKINRLCDTCKGSGDAFLNSWFGV